MENFFDHEKKSIVLFFFVILLLVPVTAGARESPARGLFVSVIQDPPVLSSRKDIDRLVEFAHQTHARILFVQIYRANQAWFPSKSADASPYQDCFKKVHQDPFKLLIRKAHSSGIEVHAWLNLLSLGANTRAPILKKYGEEILTRNEDKKRTLEDYKIDDQYFLEPGDPRVREELSVITQEVLQAYPDLDGLQFDYIRYPDKNPFYGYTKVNIKRFEKKTGRVPSESDRQWKDWRRAQVTGLLQTLIRKAHQIRPHIQISTTGCMSYTRAYEEAFQDWAMWLKMGYLDFVTVMSYSADAREFEKYVLEIRQKAGTLEKTNLAIGAYKLLGYPPAYGKLLRACDEADPRGCITLHYGSLLENPKLARMFAQDKKT